MLRLVTSKDTRIAFSETLFGINERECMSSLTKLFTYLINGFKRISIKLLNQCVSQIGLATLGRKCKSIGSLSSKIPDCVSSHLLLIKRLLWIFGNP